MVIPNGGHSPIFGDAKDYFVKAATALLRCLASARVIFQLPRLVQSCIAATVLAEQIGGAGIVLAATQTHVSLPFGESNLGVRRIF